MLSSSSFSFRWSIMSVRSPRCAHGLVREMPSVSEQQVALGSQIGTIRRRLKVVAASNLASVSEPGSEKGKEMRKE